MALSTSSAATSKPSLTSLWATWADDAENEDEAKHFAYRSGMYITEFFRELETEYQHDGSTRHRWVADVLEQMLAEPHDGSNCPPEIFCRLIDQW